MPVLWSRRTKFPVHSVAFQRDGQHDVLAVATCANFGFYPTYGVGGRVELLSHHESDAIETRAGPSDLAWAHSEPGVLFSSFNDGSVAAYSRPDGDTARRGLRVVSSILVTSAELSGISTTALDPSAVAISAWDGNVRVLSVPSHGGEWQVARTVSPHRSAKPERPEIHAVCHSPENPSLLVAACADGNSFLLDIRASANASPACATLHHQSECLDVDWGFSAAISLIAVGGADGCVSMWDSRRCTEPLSVSKVHSWGVRRVRIAPRGMTLALGRRQASVPALTCSFDMTAVLTYISLSSLPGLVRPQLLYQLKHKEFVCGGDFNTSGTLFATGGWDRLVVVSSVTHLATSSRL
jgi:hypothetical protein